MLNCHLSWYALSNYVARLVRDASLQRDDPTYIYNTKGFYSLYNFNT